MYNDKPLVLSQKSKKKYLNSLIGKCHKILHLLQEEESTGYSPKSFIYGQMLEVNEANALFEGDLVNIVVKLKLVYNKVDTEEYVFQDCRRQMFEIVKILNNMIKIQEEQQNGC